MRIVNFQPLTNATFLSHLQPRRSLSLQAGPSSTMGALAQVPPQTPSSSVVRSTNDIPSTSNLSNGNVANGGDDAVFATPKYRRNRKFYAIGSVVEFIFFCHVSSRPI